MRRLLSLLAVLALCAALSPAVAGAGQGAARIVYLPQGTEAEALAVGPEGNLWFAGSHRGADAANVVGRIVNGGALDERKVPESGSALGVGDLAPGPDGNMWFTEPAGNRIDFEAPAGGNPGVLVLPAPGSRPTGVATAGNAVWVTLAGIGKLEEVVPSTASGTDYTLPGGWSPSAVALGSDGALWAIDATAPQIARKFPAGTVVTYPPPSFAQGARYSDIIAGPDGSLWVSRSDGSYVGRIEPASSTRYKQFLLPTGGGISKLSTGPHDDVWFASGGRIGSIDPEGQSFGTPTCAIHSCAAVKALTEGPEGALWFAAGGAIGRFEPAPLTVRLRSGLRPNGKKRVNVALGCSGGAAGQRCRGKLELLARKGGARLGSGRFAMLTSYDERWNINLSRTAQVELAQKGKLPVRLVVKLGGAVVAGRNLVLHALR